MMSGGGYGEGVESSRAAAARLQQKRPRYETTSSSSLSVDGFMLGGNKDYFGLGHLRRTVMLGENKPKGLLVQKDAEAKWAKQNDARLAQGTDLREVTLLRARQREAKETQQAQSARETQQFRIPLAELRKRYREATQLRARSEAKETQQAQSARREAKETQHAQSARETQQFRTPRAELLKRYREATQLRARSEAKETQQAQLARREAIETQQDQWAREIPILLEEIFRLLGRIAEVTPQRMRQPDFSEEVISEYLKTRVLRPSHDQDKDEICTVCHDHLHHDDYDDDEGNKTNGDITTLDCLHHFHYRCIQQWLHRKNVCPLCNRTAIII